MKYVYTATGDTFSRVPYVKIRVHSVSGLHHMTVGKIARAVARQVWGESASAIALGGGVFELVWCGAVAPLPEFMAANYGQYSTTGTIDLVGAAR